MRVLITGARGMLGRTLLERWKDWDLIPCDLAECDITELEPTVRFIVESRPDAVVHCAAMTAVDACESDREKAFRINAVGTANVALGCRRTNARMVAISTDYVFSGVSGRPWRESDETQPATVYGQSKLAGERAIRLILPHKHVIARTAWLYGPGGPSFVETMLKLADGTRPELKVVHDQHGNPTSTFALADILRELLLHPKLNGVFHTSCEGECSWFDFAGEIFRQAGVRQQIAACTTAEYPRPAPRPANSSLEKGALREAGLGPMPEWRQALTEFFADRAAR